MSKITPEILWPALRQYRHNTDNSASPTNPREGFVIAFEYDEAVRVVMGLEAELEKESFYARKQKALRIDATKKLEAELAELEKQVKGWQQQSNGHYMRVCHLEKRECDLEQQLATLRELLGIFTSRRVDKQH